MNQINTIIGIVCECLDVQQCLIRSKRRYQEIADARSIAIYLCRLQRHRTQDIADAFDLDHSAIVYHIRKVQSLVQFDKIIQDKYAKCSSKCREFGMKKQPITEHYFRTERALNGTIAANG